MIRRLALLALPVLAAPLLAPTAANAAPDPTTLPEGDAPAVTWQSGTTVHTAAGKTVTLPFGKAGNGYQVLGKRGGEWIVVVPGNAPKVVAVKGTKVRTVWNHVYDESATDYTLAPGADLIVESNYTRSSSSFVKVLDLHGKVVASKSWNRGVSLLDVSGNTLLLSGKKSTLRWTVPGKPVVAGPAATFGDLAGDLLFVDVTDDAVGPTALSAPGTPAWSSDVFVPMRLSPDGQYVAGLNYATKLRLEVRKVSDGSVLPVPGYRLTFDTPVAWEPDGSLLFGARSGSARMLVRCTVAGVCERATTPVKGQVLDFPS